MRRSGMATFSAANAVAQAAALLRYMLLARLLGPEQLGLAAILILTSQFFEAVTDGGLDRFLIQSAAGNRGSANRAVHLVLIGRGLAIGAAILLSAGLVARLYHDPALRTGLMLLAVAPVIGGLAHLDYRRVQRHHRFGPEGRVILASELAGLAATVACAVATRSFVAVAAGMIARATVIVLVSHMVARRPYRIGFSRLHLPAMAAFGMPLMLNGVLLFVAGQGDRLFIGTRLGATELGHYSAIILLIFYPATMLSRLIQSVSLPVIAAARDQPAVRARAIERLTGQAVLMAAAMALAFAIVAPVAVPLIYGAGFRQPALLIALVGILQATRFVRLAPVTTALATGHSRIVMWNGIVRLVAFPLAFALQGPLGGLAGVVVAFTLGEFVAFGSAFTLLARSGLGAPTREAGQILSLAVLLAALAAILHGWTRGSMPETAAGLAGVAAAAAVLGFRERDALREMFDLLVRRRGPAVATTTATSSSSA